MAALTSVTMGRAYLVRVRVMVRVRVRFGAVPRLGCELPPRYGDGVKARAEAEARQVARDCCAVDAVKEGVV